ncbi:MAG TPA: hypothetical protein VM123_07890 [archaeon]|nr:hypothetical protein [archaeon]
MILRSGKLFFPFLLIFFLGIFAAPGCTSQPADKTGSGSSAGPAAAASQLAGSDLKAVPRPITEQLERWTESTLNWVAGTLWENPPGTGDPGLRKLALITLDDPLHLREAPGMKTVGDFFQRMTTRALDQLEAEQVSSGATVWKLYNHTFILKTISHTFAFDIYRGVERVALSEKQLERLAGMVDLLFISHFHRDHADYGLAQLMVERGKKVIVPEDLWLDTEIASSLIRVPGGQESECGGLRFMVFPGHQGSDITNNVYLVQADSIRVMHTGDQSNSADFAAWIDGLGRRYHVDILHPNCWTTDLPRMIREVDPQVVITGHENELGHTVDHRESFAKTYSNLQAVEHPYVVMSWGERFHYSGTGSP